MTLETFYLSEITPYPNNPRKNEDAVKAVAESIKQCSYITPIIVDEDKVILAGHTRYKALELLGYEKAPCLMVEGLSEEQKKKYRYLDNKTGEKATWDISKLEKELEGIDLQGFDFFGMAKEIPIDFTPNKEITGVTEYDTEVFEDEKFKYRCPKCGFLFN